MLENPCAQKVNLTCTGAVPHPCEEGSKRQKGKERECVTTGKKRVMRVGKRLSEK